jgi:hypothetical protein
VPSPNNLHGVPFLQIQSHLIRAPLEIRNRLLASLTPEVLTFLARHLREVPIEQGETSRRELARAMKSFGGTSIGCSQSRMPSSKKVASRPARRPSRTAQPEYQVGEFHCRAAASRFWAF